LFGLDGVRLSVCTDGRGRGTQSSGHKGSDDAVGLFRIRPYSALLQRWRRPPSLENASVNVIPDQVLADLKRRYAESQRAYHNWTHIEELLAQFDANASTLNYPFAFRLAILFHDAIYDPRASDNEARSAELFESTMKDAVSPDDVICARDLILATHKHTTSAVDRRFVADAELFLDMDLSILGASERRFDEYDAAIREEYSFVPVETYRQRRAEILKSFLERPRLYLTDDYHNRLDGRARANLQRAIDRLER
jgi:predicted metal-dependent HD superfamily phosphohydrolase